ncbi:PREDICTED: cytosolic sulfotransferase 16-like [Tarenaya hassleriana]|uniref:cytosolic sulfotransferase 16-like n=1 Tax=Tarenaya hassleriana TaxID=28532 RepID=UPI00053C31AB|nr:PREDICTED: cytosolic sulfotransferase 16-like [Tarenaya hassleriana]
MESKTDQTELQKNQKRYREIITRLPEKKGWRQEEILSEFGGHWWRKPNIQGLLHARENFRARPDDFVICSYPKTGTTWLKALTFAIINRFKFDEATSPLLKRLPHEFVPYLEVEFAFFPEIDVLKDKANTLFATHIPFGLLPKSILDSDCKMAYIWRDPKDTFISLWAFLHKEKSEDGEMSGLEESFDMFCKGVSVYGPYLDHVFGYWKAKQENPKKIMFLKYEEMRANPIPYVKRLAEFMGYGFTEEEEAKGNVERVVNLCSFETLKNLKTNKGEKGRKDRPGTFANSAFFRKGEVGDWMNYLTPEMAARIDGLMENKFRGSGLLRHDR